MLKLKIIILPIILLTSFNIFALGEKVIATKEELKVCMDGNERKMRSCEVDIVVFKKKYQAFLGEGYPKVEKVSKSFLRKCIAEGIEDGEKQVEYNCNRIAFESEMEKNKRSHLLKLAGLQKKKPSLPKDLQTLRFMKYKGCLIKNGDKDYCLQISNESNEIKEVTNCGLFGQSEGYCNGFHYTRSGSVMKDIGRKLSGSSIINNQKAPEESGTVAPASSGINTAR